MKFNQSKEYYEQWGNFLLSKIDKYERLKVMEIECLGYVRESTDNKLLSFHACLKQCIECL